MPESRTSLKILFAVVVAAVCDRRSFGYYYRRSWAVATESKFKGIFSLPFAARNLCCAARFDLIQTMNAELCKRANEKVGNPNVLVNIVSRRVRQLNSGGGGLSRPLIDNVGNLGAADIALREILEDKIGWKLPEIVALIRPVAKKRKKK
jgi:DNA-directed RNA polymerase subunit omega